MMENNAEPERKITAKFCSIPCFFPKKPIRPLNGKKKNTAKIYRTTHNALKKYIFSLFHLKKTPHWKIPFRKNLSLLPQTCFQTMPISEKASHAF